MAYGFNEDRSKVTVYSADEVDDIVAEVASDLADEVADRQAGDNTLDARISNLAQLTDGSTTGDAELIDIRTGYDGTVYTVAGDAVREQIDDIHKAITAFNEFVSDGEINLKDMVNWEIGGIASATGQDVAGNNTIRSSFINAENLSFVHIIVKTVPSVGSTFCIFRYDASKTFIDRTERTVLGTTDVPIDNGTKYLRFVCADFSAQIVTINEMLDCVDFYAGSIFENLEDVESISYIKNIIDTSQIEQDKYWAGYNTKQTAPAGENYCCIKIPVEKGKHYSSSLTIDGYYSWFYSGVGVYSKLSETSSWIIHDATFGGIVDFIPANNGYLHLTMRTTRPTIVVEDTANTQVYGDYDNLSYISLEGNRASISHIIYVSKDGTGDFDKLSDGISEAIKYVNSIVYVGAGTYDLIDEFGDDYLNAIDSSSPARMGIILTNNVHVIFSSNSLVTAHYTGSNQYVYSKFSAFNSDSSMHSGFILDNLTLQCSNIRYCIHDDPSTNSKIPYKNVYKNCDMFIDNTNNPYWTAEACIGGGCGQASEVVIENCVFDSAVQSGWYPDVVSYHNNDSAATPNKSRVVITGCYFGGTSRCRCSNHGTTTDISTMIVSNCSLASEPRVIFETNNDTVVNFQLIQWNNEIRN